MAGAGSMKILDEGTLRAALLHSDATEYRVERGTFVTPLAREYLRDRGIALVFGEPVRKAQITKTMPRTPIEARGERTFVDAESGAGYAEKPERMTHLAGNRLVPKTHPRIALRGKLDTLQGEIILAQAEADEAGKPDLARDLGELLELARELLGAEVTERALKPLSLFGCDADEIRRISHRVDEAFGIPHPVPHHGMGRLAARLNLLRAQSREAELAAEAAFPDGNRADILMAMNRMSSAIYILFCKLLAGRYGNQRG